MPLVGASSVTEAQEFRCQMPKPVTGGSSLAPGRLTGRPSVSRGSSRFRFGVINRGTTNSGLSVCSLPPSPACSRHLTRSGTFRVSEGPSINLRGHKGKKRGSSGCLLAGTCFLHSLVGCRCEGNGLERTQELPAAACQPSERAFVPFRAAVGVESMFSIGFLCSSHIYNGHFSLPCLP